MRRIPAILACGALVACAEGSGGSGPGGDPLGTFCWELNASGNEICLDPAGVTAVRTTTAGYVWF